ncbi:MAG: DUF2905 domain-containing protein [Actinomycetota bacterium]|nr:DUF2905 domain-containing protein [Actinomycetota bacterium]
MDVRGLGSTLMVVGAIIVLAGFALSRGWLGWFGRLPGDIRIVSDNTRVYIPIVSMLLVSVVLTVVLNVIRRL